ncbi:methionyl-tRNA formyltransferase [Candidatus Kaiserbacteria bacterium RIFCSPHIGHO2_02_FULL_50_50]|uniref:methionyl-tRNA formyltransferase n=1 Tax=Candidatus Kaiserbacteria bacterium RIFCSPHIGHO2_02_FULL_50_50 TaxID=1798492 RepID=A0A1F6DFU7_9BACT|nr:MAG: methionyl-tRNA formyltransferase [Candidatus Kaiserbacteria bacterium RIFCSPHIGHO2_02_FULL_50_50]OGG88874.1 MAG: methionyl-tRNA formyltransferase [Candidatus Kaiserbacteria bacterium RIFCSPLOWO2_12_FULL_50_10]
MKSFIFFGTPHVAAETLQALLTAGFVPSLVVTNPDRPAGRGRVMTPSPVRVLAESHNIPVFMPEKLDDDAQVRLAEAQASYAICVAYGKIIPERFIVLFPQGILNIHYSLLPKYRGATPTEAALLANDAETGVTIQKMVYELDAGDIIAQEKIAIEPQWTVRELRPKLIELGAKMLIITLPQYLAGEIIPQPQEHSLATRCGKFEKSDGELTLDEVHAANNWRKYRAYADTIGTYFFEERAGTMVRIKIITATFDGTAFTPLRVIPEGKKEMDFIR